MVAEKVKESTDISEARLLRYWKEAAPRFETEENSDILPETNIFAPENGGPPGKGESYWKPSFLGAMLEEGRYDFSSS